MEIIRGDVVLCVAPGDYGKPRPAVVVQADLFNPTHASILVLPITSHRIDTPLFRVPVSATKKNGLRVKSEVMVDKVTALRRDRIRKQIGRLSDRDTKQCETALRTMLAL